MENNLDQLSIFVEKIKEMQATIITNTLLIGQIPAPTFKERKRANAFLDRLAEFQVDECTMDGYRNPIGIIHGTAENKPPIFIVAHLDSAFDRDIDHDITILGDTMCGPGLLDNSIGVGTLLSLPEILKRLDVTFQSDIVLSAVIQSIGKGNLRGIRHLLKTWKTPIRGAICLEGGELGRLSYFCDGMIRCEIVCNIATNGWIQKFKPNAILILHEVITQILRLKLPQRPRARVIIGKISGGYKHGMIAYDAKLGFEIQGDSDKMVKNILNDIKDIVEGIGHEHQVELKLKTISNINANRLHYSHPLVKNTVAVIKKLGLKPISASSESELSIFLSHKIPAVTLGITRGEDSHLESAKVEIEPMSIGIAQIIGVLQAIDNGACDE